MNDENPRARLERYNKLDINASAAIKKVGDRGGRTLQFRSNIAAGTLTLDEYTVTFYEQPDGSFAIHSFSGFGTENQIETKDHCHLIDEACAQFAEELEAKKKRSI